MVTPPEMDSLYSDILRRIIVPLDGRSTHALLLTSRNLHAVVDTLWSAKLEDRFGRGGRKDVYVRSLRAGSPRFYPSTPFLRRSLAEGWKLSTTERIDIVRCDACIFRCHPFVAVVTLFDECLVETQYQQLSAGPAHDALVTSTDDNADVVTRYNRQTTLHLCMFRKGKLTVVHKIRLPDCTSLIAVDHVNGICTIVVINDGDLVVVTSNGSSRVMKRGIVAAFYHHSINSVDWICSDGTFAHDDKVGYRPSTRKYIRHGEKNVFLDDGDAAIDITVCDEGLFVLMPTGCVLWMRSTYNAYILAYIVDASVG
jgi:hypothetical protein